MQALHIDEANSLALVATNDRKLRAYDLAAGAPIATYAGHADCIRAIGFLPDKARPEIQGINICSNQSYWDLGKEHCWCKTLFPHLGFGEPVHLPWPCRLRTRYWLPARVGKYVTALYMTPQLPHDTRTSQGAKSTMLLSQL